MSFPQSDKLIWSETKLLGRNVELQIHPLAVSGEAGDEERSAVVGIPLCYVLNNQTFRGQVGERDPQQQEQRLRTFFSPFPGCAHLFVLHSARSCVTKASHIAHRGDLCMSPKVEQLKDEVCIHPRWPQLGTSANTNPRAPVSRSSRPAPWPA